MAPTNDELWVTYKATGDRRARDELSARYTPLVVFWVRRVAARLPHYVDRDDLSQEGFIGLLDAIDRFDPTRGVRFETYAPTRIVGAVRDAHREQDWAPRSVRSHARQIDAAMAKLEAALSRSPTDAEIAAELGMDPTRYHRVVEDIWLSSVQALEDLLRIPGDLAGRGSGPSSIADVSAPDPLLLLEAAEERAQLEWAVNAVSERARLIITLYYFEGMTLSQIGEVLGVSESRICQLHRGALRTLRTLLATPETV